MAPNPSTSVARTPSTAPKISALRVETWCLGTGRRRVRRITSSMSASITQLKVLADAAANSPPIITTRMSSHGGSPPAARNMAGAVVTRSSSMIRGFVSAT